MRVGVVGSRTINDQDWIFGVLDRFHQFSPVQLIVSGGAKGVDTLAELWAQKNGIPASIFIPDYSMYGARAPFKRNTDIVENSDIVMAFWNGKSTGTLDSIQKARRMKKILKIYEKEETKTS